MNPYLKTKILTASPEELRLMLYDGAIKFCRQAHDAINRKDWEGMYNALQRAQNIVLELNNSLNHQVANEMCEKLASLYNYIFRRMVDTNMERDVDAIIECIQLLEFEKESWLMVMKGLTEQHQGGTVDEQQHVVPTEMPDTGSPLATIGPRYPGANAEAGSTLSVQG